MTDFLLFLTFRTPLLFGDNVRVGCSFPVQRSTLATSCSGLKNKTLTILMGPGIDPDMLSSTFRVGTFGNTLTSEEGDWIPIIIENPPSMSPLDGSQSGSDPASTRPGVCPNMVLSLHVEVAHASAGTLANPQQRVLGVRYRFGAPVDVAFTCAGSACDRERAGGGKGNHQSVQLVSSVTFLDVSEPAVDRFKDFPVIEAKLPYDFFYPFVGDEEEDRRTTNAGNVTTEQSVFIFILMLVLNVFLCK